MCGIAGEVTFNGAPVNPRHLEAMADTLVHRGPDADGLYVAPHHGAGLAFRRLRIIDLTASGNQPMPNEDGSIQLVFNGEIYNFRELRKRLEAKGHIFRSRTDSEVIVHLYEDEGPDAITMLDGMFAIAIWDDRERRLVLARDRTGKKPLFYSLSAQRIRFASEIKALLACPDFRADVNVEAIPYFFMYGYVHNPDTIYRGVKQVPPATILTIDRNGRAASRQYWSYAAASDQARRATGTEPAAASRVRALVTQAVERRLVSDVPFGAFLSGGVDSTIVVGVMSRLLGEPVKTFSIGFEGDAAYDETTYARLAAKSFGTDHTEFIVKPSAVELVDKLIWHHDGPFADSSAIPTYIVSELTRRHVTVVLNGDGGDELFAGYLRFRAGVLSEMIPRPVGVMLDRVLSRLPSPSRHRHWLAFAQRFARALELPLHARLTRWNALFYDDLPELLRPEILHEPVDPLRYLDGEREHLGALPTTLAKLLYANFITYLPGDLSVKMDRCTMANSLEARSPFLDTALIEYVAGLPDEMKLRGKRTKVILREAFSDLLPQKIDRRSKMGFGVPLGTWFRGELREYLCDHLLDPGARYRAYLAADAVHRLVQRHLAGHTDAGQRLWTILCFERWLRMLPGWVRSDVPTTATSLAPSVS